MASFEDYNGAAVPQAPLSVNRVTELTNAEKMDLIILSANPSLQVLWKFMEMEIIAARDEAVGTDPSKPQEQVAKLTIAHSMEQFYKRTRSDIAYMTQEHLAEARRLHFEKQIQEPDEFEKAFFGNLTP